MEPWIVVLIGVVLVILVFSSSGFSQKEDFPKGKILYLQYCETCHGQEGKGAGYTFFQLSIADLTFPAIQ